MLAYSDPRALLRVSILLFALLGGCQGQPGSMLRVLDLSSSPDGTTLVVSAFAMPRDGITLVYDCRTGRLVSETRERDLVQKLLTWGPGANRLLLIRGYAAPVLTPREGLFLVDPRRHTERLVGSLELLDRAVVSPDGQEIVYSVSEHVPGKPWDRMVTSSYRVPMESQFFTLDVPIVTGYEVIGVRRVVGPGYEIVLYRRVPSEVMRLHVPSGHRTTYRVPRLQRESWALSPRGQGLAGIVEDSSGRRALLLHLSKGNRRLSPPIWGTPTRTAWSADGRFLACFGGAGLTRVDGQTGRLTTLVSPRDDVTSCAWVGGGIVFPRGGQLLLVDSRGREHPFCTLPRH